MKLILELEQFDIVRKFMIVFLASVNSLSGFLIFFALILFAFTTTEAIVKKSNIRLNNLTGKYEPYSI